MCVCVYGSLQLCAHARHIFANIDMHTNMKMHACAHTHTRIYIPTYMHACIRTYIYIYMDTYVHIYVHTYMCTYTCMHMYIYTYTHIFKKKHALAHMYIYVYIYICMFYVCVHMYMYMSMLCRCLCVCVCVCVYLRGRAFCEPSMMCTARLMFTMQHCKLPRQTTKTILHSKTGNASPLLHIQSLKCICKRTACEPAPRTYHWNANLRIICGMYLCGLVFESEIC